MTTLQNLRTDREVGITGYPSKPLADNVASAWSLEYLALPVLNETTLTIREGR